MRRIALGEPTGSRYEVLDGLAEGERVIISSISEFEDFETIQVVD